MLRPPGRAPRTRSRSPTGGTCGTTCVSTPPVPSPATRTALRDPPASARARASTAGTARSSKSRSERARPLTWRRSSPDGTRRRRQCPPPPPTPHDLAPRSVIRGPSPHSDATARPAAAFANTPQGRHGSRLDDWITAVDAASGQADLHSFTTGIRQDYQAVRNGLTLSWNSGRVEGLNTRTKLLKRQMYGRAAFPLLRKPILHTS